MQDLTPLILQKPRKNVAICSASILVLRSLQDARPDRFDFTVNELINWISLNLTCQIQIVRLNQIWQSYMCQTRSFSTLVSCIIYRHTMNFEGYCKVTLSSWLCCSYSFNAWVFLKRITSGLIAKCAVTDTATKRITPTNGIIGPVK